MVFSANYLVRMGREKNKRKREKEKMSEKNELETTFRMFATFYVMKHRRVWNK